MTEWLSRQARTHRYFHIVFWALCLVCFVLILRSLASVVGPLAVACAIAYWLDPVVDFVERRGLKRTPAILVLLLFLVALFAGIVLIVVPVVVREVGMVGEKFPVYVRRMHNELLPWLEKVLHTTLPKTLGELLDRAGADAQMLAKGAMSSLQTLITGTFNSLFSVLRFLLNLVLVPVMAFYLLRDFDKLLARIEALIPERRRPLAVGIAKDIDRVLSAWFRGQLTVVVIDGTLYIIGLSILGVPMAVAIGALAGILAFVPVVGLITALSLTLCVTLLEFQGWWQVLGVVALFAAVPTIEMTVVVPRVVGGRVGLGPVAVIVALLLGAELLGFIGVLLAVPTAAVVNVLVGRLLEAYERSLFYTGQGGSGDSPPEGAQPPGGAP